MPEERVDRPAPLRLRVRPLGPEKGIDPFDFAADVLDPVTPPPADTPAVSAELEADQIYAGRYRIEEVLGRTHGADRYVAIQEPLVRRVVLTVLRGSPAAETTVLLESRFLREAGLLSRMRHPSLAPVHEAGRAPGGTCFATEELLYGFTLRDLIDRGSLGPDRLVAIAADIAGALAALHEAGVSHRCLRVDQIVVGPRVWRGGAGAEVAQVGRYGLEVTPEDVVENQDPESALAWAPEVLRGEEPDESADLYSLGVILYRALAGRAPYEGTASMIMGARTQGDPPTLVRDRDGGLADKLRDVAERCLQANPEQRYASARSLLAVLEELAQAPAVVPVAPLPVPVLVPAAPQPLPLRGLFLAGLAGAVVPTIAVVALLLTTPFAPPESVPEFTSVPAVTAAAIAPVVTQPVVTNSPAAPAVEPDPAPTIEAPSRESEPPSASASKAPAERAPALTARGTPPPSNSPASNSRVSTTAGASRALPSAVEAPTAPTAPPQDAAVVVAAAEPVAASKPAQPAPAKVTTPVVPGAAALSGLWLGRVAGSSFALDIAVAPDGRMTGRARRSDGTGEGIVAGRVSSSDDGLRLEFQVTEGIETTSYSGGVVGGQLRGRIYAGGKAQGRFTAER